VTAVNGALAANPALVNASPEKDAWFFKMKLANPSDLDGLMDAAAYRTYVKDLG